MHKTDYPMVIATIMFKRSIAGRIELRNIYQVGLPNWIDIAKSPIKSLNQLL